MSIASEITRLQGVKADILQAIEDKGVTVPADSMLDDCPDLIASISTGGGDEPFIPPVPSDVTLFESLFSTRDIGSYDNNYKIEVNLLNDTVNTDSIYEVDFETRNTERTQGFNLFESTIGSPDGNCIMMGWYYSYTNSTMLQFRNGGSSVYTSVSTAWGNKRSKISVCNSTMVNNDTNAVVFTDASGYTANKKIGTLAFPGQEEMKASKMLYHSVKISKYGAVLMELVPAKKGNVAGFYDKVSSNFFSASDPTAWDCA